MTPQIRNKTSAELDRLATEIRRLGPDHRDPEKFHEDKSEIAHRLRRLSRAIENGRAA